MANTEANAGVDSFLLYGKETGYNVEQTTCETHFGLVKNFKPKFNNNIRKSRGYKGTTTGGRNMAKAVPLSTDIGASLDFEVINWAFLEHVLGAVSGSGTLTYSELDNPPSMTLHRAIENPGASGVDQDLIQTGAVIDSVTIKAAVGEPVQVSATIISANRKFDTTIISEVALPSVDVFTFAGASIELPNATVLDNIIDSLEITISNNYKGLPGLGSRNLKNAKAGERDYDIKFTVKYLDNDLTEAVQGSATPGDTTNPTEYASIECNFVNGSKSCAFLFSTFTFSDQTGNEENATTIADDLSGTAVSCTVTEVE